MKHLFLDRIAFSIFGFEIYWYGILIGSALVFAFLFVMLYCKKKNYHPFMAFEMTFAAVVPAILFARLFFVMFEKGVSIADYFAFRDGGLSIIGAVIGGAAGLGVLSLVRKKNFFFYADIVAPVLILGQAIGRWGNYFNQEVYGKLINDNSLKWFPFAVEIEGQWFLALFFYEFVLNMIGFALLFTLLFKSKKKGVVTGTYLIFYGAVRTALEGFRDPQFILTWGTVPISRVMSLLMMIAGLVILLLAIFIKKKTTEKIQPKGE